MLGNHSGELALNLPEQCTTCRHVVYRAHEALCNTRMMSRCLHEGNLQKLATSRVACELLNPENCCPAYQQRLFAGLDRVFSGRRWLLTLLAALIAAITGIVLAKYFPGLAWKTKISPWTM